MKRWISSGQEKQLLTEEIAEIAETNYENQEFSAVSSISAVRSFFGCVYAAPRSSWLTRPEG
jgi:hypothetical protein